MGCFYGPGGSSYGPGGSSYGPGGSGGMANLFNVSKLQALFLDQDKEDSLRVCKKGKPHSNDGTALEKKQKKQARPVADGRGISSPQAVADLNLSYPFCFTRPKPTRGVALLSYDEVGGSDKSTACQRFTVDSLLALVVQN